MSVKLTYEQKRAILLTLQSVPDELKPLVGSVRITDSGKIQVFAKPGVVVPLSGPALSEGPPAPELPKDPISARDVRKARRKVSRIQGGKQRISVGSKGVFDALVDEYNALLVSLQAVGLPTTQQIQPLQTLYDNLFQVGNEPDQKFDRTKGNKRLPVQTTGNRSIQRVDNRRFPPMQNNSAAPAVMGAAPAGGAPIGSVSTSAIFSNSLFPAVPASSVILQSTLQLSIPPVANATQVWLFASSRLPTQVVTGAVLPPATFDWLSWAMTDPNTQMVMTSILQPGRGYNNRVFTNSPPLTPALINSNRLLLSGTARFDLGFLLVSSTPIAANMNWNLRYLQPMQFDNTFHFPSR